MRQQLRLFCICLAFGVCTAAAQEETTESTNNNFIEGLEAQIGTEVPISVGVRVRADLPSDFYALAGVGYSPPFMANTIGSLANSLGMLGPNTSKVASLALNNAFVLDLGFGYKIRTSRNFFDGFFVNVGYQLMVGNGGDENITTVEGATGNIYYLLPTNDTVNVKSTIHSVTGHFGYTFTGMRHLVITGEVGIIKPLAAVNRVTPNVNLTDPTDYLIVQNDVNNTLNNAKNNLVIPTLSLWLSYMF
jgi:hypothetical protein